MIGFDLQNNVIEQIANGRVAESEVLSHDFEAAAADDKRNNKVLLLLGKAG